MNKLFLLISLSIFFISCKSTFEVDEFCKIKSKVPGEYGTYSQVLYLIENNDTVGMQIDTMYFKVDKKTNNKFKLENRQEYEANSQNINFDVEKYIYLDPSNDHESAWNGTLVLYSIPKYTDWIECICTKDVD